ncbi:AMP-binding protein [Litorivivens sp.]|uniref:AMP-binding protein n=1 Tax=Litorivivens sp. TaxID=2020868 RepID=UPI003567D00E
MSASDTFQQACAAAPQGMEISAIARLAPTRRAICSEHGNRDFQTLNQRANQIARCLREAGLKAGDPIALVCGNRPEFVEVVMASHRLGLRLTPVNWHLKPEEIAYIVDDCEARALFADIRISEAATAAAKLSSRLVMQLSIGGVISGFDALESAIADFSGEDIDEPARGSVMQYTSGTTGRPKGVLRKQADPAKAAEMQQLITAVFQYQPESGTDCSLATGPLYHAGPFNLCMLTPLSAGIGIVLMDKWEPEQTLKLIAEHRVTHSFFVPTMFNRLLQLPESVRKAYDISSLRFVIHGAAPCPPSVKQQMLDWFGPIIWELFAGTEGPGTFVSPQEWLAKPGTVGKPGPDQVRILDESGKPVEAGEEGQIWMINPPDSKFEYFKAPEKTASAQRDGYYTAGDIGYLDTDGYLFLTGRSAETIISGGVNIYPQEIDDVLAKHPAVADVACVGVPNEEWGEEVKALVQLVPGATGDAALAKELQTFCSEHLSSQKVPRSVEYLDEIPRSEAGKVYRKALRDRYWGERKI